MGKATCEIQPAATVISAGPAQHRAVEQKDDKLGSELGCLYYPKPNVAPEEVPILPS